MWVQFCRGAARHAAAAPPDGPTAPGVVSPPHPGDHVAMNSGQAAEPAEAQSGDGSRLTLPEEFLLLALREVDGRRQLSRSVLKVGVAGAKLAELAVLKAIDLRGMNVTATGRVPETEYEHELELIRDKSRPHTAHHWVSQLESGRELRRICERLVEKGIVDHTAARALGIIPVTRYPRKDHGYDAALQGRIEKTLAGGVDDPRTEALIALLDVGGLLRRVVGKPPDPARLNEVARHQWPAHAVAAELGAIAFAEEEART